MLALAYTLLTTISRSAVLTSRNRVDGRYLVLGLLPGDFGALLTSFRESDRNGLLSTFHPASFSALS
jgi:hypothetical protein